MKTKLLTYLLSLGVLLSHSYSVKFVLSSPISTKSPFLHATKNVLDSKRKPAAYTSTLSPFLLLSPFASWGVKPSHKKANINLLSAWKMFKKKKDVVIAVVDTGISYNHPYLKGNIHVIKGKVNKSNYGVDFSTQSKKVNFGPFDSHGHGTHVSGIIKSVFPSVKILTLKYYNPHASGQKNLDATLMALQYAVDKKCRYYKLFRRRPSAL